MLLDSVSIAAAAYVKLGRNPTPSKHGTEPSQTGCTDFQPDHIMASMAGQSYTTTGLFPQQQHNDGFNSYPEPPQNTFASASPMDMGVSYPAATTSVGFEPSLYAETSSYILTGHPSPGVYADDILSSGLSASSIPSAPSSAVGSPQTNHGQLGVSDWSNNSNNNTMSLHPSIVGSDYMSGTEYYHNAMDDYATFDFGAQPKSFVGKSSAYMCAFSFFLWACP